MKSNRIFLSVIPLLFSFTVYAGNSPELVDISFKKVYAPEGFDDNDNVQLVGEGTMSNSCYRYANTSFDVDVVKKRIIIKTTAYKYSGMCLMMIVPFDREIDLGILKPGSYSIVQAADGKEISHITIKHAASDGPDDFLYAPITRAAFDSGCITDNIVLQGSFSLSCLKIKEVRLAAQTDVVVLQPLVEIDKTLPCTDGNFPFQHTVNVGFLRKGRYLAHVRSLNGKSVNELFETPN